VTLRLPGLLLAILLVATPTSGTWAMETVTAPAATPLSAEAVQELIFEAEAARKRAAELRAEWLETGNLIDEARKLAKNGDLRQAAQRAELALRQGELAVAQAERESAAWQRRVVR
jgi:hypothetical protein